MKKNIKSLTKLQTSTLHAYALKIIITNQGWKKKTFLHIQRVNKISIIMNKTANLPF